VDFLIRYLGLPLSTKRLPKNCMQATVAVDAVARKLLACHGPLMARRGRLIWIKSILAAVPIYCMLADGLKASRPLELVSAINDNAILP
jgi:hypothetical protein